MGTSCHGIVAVTWTGPNEPRRMVRSNRKTEELIDEAYFACRLTFPLDAMTVADHAHDFKNPSELRRFHGLEAACRTDHALERAMICLKDVIIGHE